MFFCSQVEFVKKLILEAGVVAVPGQGFFHTNLSSNEVSNLNYQRDTSGLLSARVMQL